MATPRLGLVVEDKPTELSCTDITCPRQFNIDDIGHWVKYYMKVRRLIFYNQSQTKGSAPTQAHLYKHAEDVQRYNVVELSIDLEVHRVIFKHLRGNVIIV